MRNRFLIAFGLAFAAFLSFAGALSRARLGAPTLGTLSQVLLGLAFVGSAVSILLPNANVARTVAVSMILYVCLFAWLATLSLERSLLWGFVLSVALGLFGPLDVAWRWRSGKLFRTRE